MSNAHDTYNPAEITQASTDPMAERPSRQFAIVEIFGHRKHWAEIADVERAGGRFLRVHDVETDEVHNYGAAAIFNIQEISEARLNAHLAQVAAYKQAAAEREARWAAEEEARRNARLLAAAPALEKQELPDVDGDGNWFVDDSVPGRTMARLELMPAYYDQPDRVFNALRLVARTSATIEDVTGWTSEQRKLAAEWALSVSYSESDNDDVIVPDRPDFIELPF